MADDISLRLSRDHALVLFGWLARVNSGDPAPTFEDQAEQRVLWDLESSLEASLAEPLQADFRAQLDAARDRVRDPLE